MESELKVRWFGRGFFLLLNWNRMHVRFNVILSSVSKDVSEGWNEHKQVLVQKGVVPMSV